MKGYVEGQGLGPEGQGRSTPGTADRVRPKNTGLASVPELSEEQRREEQRREEQRREEERQKAVRESQSAGQSIPDPVALQNKYITTPSSNNMPPTTVTAHIAQVGSTPAARSTFSNYLPSTTPLTTPTLPGGGLHILAI